MTKAAVSEGSPPISAEMPIAIGVVTDFGASERIVSMLAPIAAPIVTAETTAASEPAASEAAIGSSVVRTRAKFR